MDALVIIIFVVYIIVRALIQQSKGTKRRIQTQQRQTPTPRNIQSPYQHKEPLSYERKTPYISLREEKTTSLAREHKEKIPSEVEYFDGYKPEKNNLEILQSNTVKKRTKALKQTNLKQAMIWNMILNPPKAKARFARKYN